VKYREIIAEMSTKLVGVGVMSQPLILNGEESGLLTHIAATESGSLCTRMELESAIRKNSIDVVCRRLTESDSR
jgi:hypothetical protein